MNDSHLILIAHGSTDPRWCKPFEDLEASLKKEVGDKKISLCYMGAKKPSLEDVVIKGIKNKFTSFKVLPLFMSGGGHVENDIPKQIQEIKTKNEKIKITLLKAVGEDPLLIGLIKEIAKSHLMF